jgi:hypothetical protein
LQFSSFYSQSFRVTFVGEAAVNISKYKNNEVLR